MSIKKNYKFSSGTSFFKLNPTSLTQSANTFSFTSENSLINRLVIMTYILIAFTLILLGLLYTKLPKEVPLFYSKAWGNDQLVKSHFLFLPLVLSVIFLQLNTYLSKKIATSTFMKISLILGAVTTSILCIITVMRIIILIVM